jgi:ABC-type glycerol-3-phosphate transport system substrate-binding protein
MKRSIKLLAAATALALLGFTSTAMAGTTSTKVSTVHELSDTEWQEIAEDAELEESTTLEVIPMLRTVSVKALEMDFKAGKQTNLVLDAPFADKDEVGVVVIDKKGEVVYSTSGMFKDLKNLRFSDYYSKDMTYVVRVYSSSNVFETKLQVVYL